MGFTAVGGMAKKVLSKSPISLGDTFNLLGAGITYNSARQQGDSRAVSLGKTAVDFAFGEMMGGWAFAYYGATIGAQVAVQMGKANAESAHKIREVGSGRVGSGSFDMTGAGYTMRQRAMNQIRNNGQQINSVLGNEARTFSRSSAYD